MNERMSLYENMLRVNENKWDIMRLRERARERERERERKRR